MCTIAWPRGKKRSPVGGPAEGVCGGGGDQQASARARARARARQKLHASTRTAGCCCETREKVVSAFLPAHLSNETHESSPLTDRPEKGFAGTVEDKGTEGGGQSHEATGLRHVCQTSRCLFLGVVALSSVPQSSQARRPPWRGDPPKERQPSLARHSPGSGQSPAAWAGGCRGRDCERGAHRQPLLVCCRPLLP